MNTVIDEKTSEVFITSEALVTSPIMVVGKSIAYFNLHSSIQKSSLSEGLKAVGAKSFTRRGYACDSFFIWGFYSENPTRTIY